MSVWYVRPFVSILFKFSLQMFKTFKKYWQKHHWCPKSTCDKSNQKLHPVRWGDIRQDYFKHFLMYQQSKKGTPFVSSFTSITVYVSVGSLVIHYNCHVNEVKTETKRCPFLIRSLNYWTLSMIILQLYRMCTCNIITHAEFEFDRVGENLGN